MAKYKSLVGGAIGDAGFEPGDLIDVPDNKVDDWLAAGLIEAPRKAPVVNIVSSDGATAGEKAN